MNIQYTCSIIKPNAVKNNLIGAIYSRIEQAKFKIIAAKMLHLNYKQACSFYIEHEKKIFFSKLINFMTSGPIMVQILAGTNVIQRYRDLMGATNPIKALAGTIRADYSDNYTANTVHGSDSIISASREINFFFIKSEIHYHV